MRSSFRKIATIITAMSALLIPTIALAANTPNLTQTVNAGTLSLNIYQSDDATPVSSPSVAFPAINRSFTCQTNTATLGDSNNKINVTNFAANNGFNVTMAATGGNTSTWTSGSDTYKFNSATGSGCTNGQLTVDPSVGTVTLDCNSACNSTNVTKGASTAFVSGSADSVTLFSNSSGSAWEGYLTGVSLSQKIPAAQVAGSYSLGMTLSVTAQ